MEQISAYTDWINLAGLTLDFAGVLLLGLEWRAALTAEERESALAAREQMFTPLPLPGGQKRPGQDNPHHQVFEAMKSRQKANWARERGANVRKERRFLFNLAIVLVIVGFVLQVIATEPLLALLM